jgi:hypothetical protein
MGIQSFTPSGGGGTPGFDYIASVQMTTYNRSWTQSGAAGNYIITSAGLNNGYAYFICGGATYGTPIGQVINLPASFTRIDIVAPQNDYISLSKVAIKSTSEFANPFAGFASFPSVVSTSGNFVLPSNALPLVNVLVLGAGGGSSDHCGGGGGGGVVSLTAYQAVGTTSCTIGAYSGGSRGGDTYFGAVHTYGGGGGNPNQSQNGTSVRNGSCGAGAGGGSAWSVGGTNVLGGTGTANTSGNMGAKGAPVGWSGFNGGYAAAGLTFNHGGAGGGGVTGLGTNRTALSTTCYGGTGIANNITGTHLMYGTGGGGGHHQGPSMDGQYPTETYSRASHSIGGNSNHSTHNAGNSGAVIVRYYIA